MAARTKSKKRRPPRVNSAGVPRSARRNKGAGIAPPVSTPAAPEVPRDNEVVAVAAPPGRSSYYSDTALKPSFPANRAGELLTPQEGNQLAPPLQKSRKRPPEQRIQ